MTFLSNLGTWFKSLLPNMKKRDIQIDVAHCYEGLVQIIQPMYSMESVPKFKGDTWDKLSLYLAKQIDIYKINPYLTIAKALKYVLDNEEAIAKLIQTTFNEEYMKVISDYHKLNIIRYLEGLTYFTDFSRKTISVLVWELLEASKNIDLPADSVVKKSPTLKRDQDFVNNLDNIAAFATVVNMLGQPLDKFLKSISYLEGHVYNEDDWTSNVAPQIDKLDPYRAGFTAVTFNMAYHAGLAINGWRLQWHELNKAELARLQLMLLALEKEKTANPDPNRLENIEKQITYYDNLANKISGKIEAMEEQG